MARHKQAELLKKGEQLVDETSASTSTSLQHSVPCNRAGCGYQSISKQRLYVGASDTADLPIPSGSQHTKPICREIGEYFLTRQRSTQQESLKNIQASTRDIVVGRYEQRLELGRFHRAQETWNGFKGNGHTTNLAYRYSRVVANGKAFGRQGGTKNVRKGDGRRSHGRVHKGDGLGRRCGGVHCLLTSHHSTNGGTHGNNGSNNDTNPNRSGGGGGRRCRRRRGSRSRSSHWGPRRCHSCCCSRCRRRTRRATGCRLCTHSVHDSATMENGQENTRNNNKQGHDNNTYAAGSI